MTPDVLPVNGGVARLGCTDPEGPGHSRELHPPRNTEKEKQREHREKKA
jgi:hypothetical protein